MLALLFAVEPNTVPSSLNPKPHVLLLLDRTNSRADPSGLNRKIPCPNRISFPPTVPRNPEYPTVPQIQLSNPYRKLLGPACVSPVPQPTNKSFRSSALSSPSVSRRNSVFPECTTITPPFAKTNPVGTLNFSANTVNLSAFPSPFVSSKIFNRSRPCPGGCISFG